MQLDNRLCGHLHTAVGDGTGNSFDPRYLAAKKSIDDRALNHHVWETLRQALPQTTGGEPACILEIGAGIGTMLERVVDRGLLTGSVTYVATDSDPGQLRAARNYLSQWAGNSGHTLSWSGEFSGRLRTAQADVSLVLFPARAEDLAGKSSPFGPFHLLIAHAVLDLIDFPVVLPQFVSQLKENGLAYLSCNFDGETFFVPEHENDKEILGLYHGSMETRLPGASHTGRRLLAFSQGQGLELLAVGSSDWIIHPRNNRYTEDEAFFLHAIVATVEQELAKNASPQIGLTAWADLRHRQIETGALSFLARHLDLLTRRQPTLA
jgi:hypothetical protein